MSKLKTIPSFPDYRISENGTVIGPNGKLSPRPDRDGYERVDLRKNGRRFTRFVHTLVSDAFNGESSEVDHLDNDRSNNSVDNLEPVSHQENMTRLSERHKKRNS